MVSYSSQTVAQLKELLKQKGLSAAGVKSDLIARLEESDQQEQSKADSLVPEATEEKIVDKEEEQQEQQEDKDNEKELKPVYNETLQDSSKEGKIDSSNVSNDKKDETKNGGDEADGVSKEELQNLTPEEKKQKAIELLIKKIERAKKFGEERLAETHEKELKRVEKFGLELSSDLARELGFGKPLPSAGKNFKRKFNN
ncbi:hypothetical protein PACTADRAFT_23058, partial [Pachysolen tannophilus NRRL Y-2460]